MESPKISVIVPCYKVEKYMDRCINSILNQTIKEIEVIIIDDGSPDKVPEKCDYWASKDNRIKVIHKSNGGLGFARNSGMEIAKGEYIAFVDSDDYIENSMYEKLLQIVSENDADAVFCGFRVEIRPNKWIEHKEVVEETIFENEDIWSFALGMIASSPHTREERHYAMPVWRSLYKRNIITNSNLRFESEREIVSEDLPFNIDFLKKSKKVILIPDIYYNYCLNEGSLNKSFLPEKYDRMKSLYNLVKMKSINPEIDNMIMDRFFIGIVRAHILQLQKTDRSDKKEIIRKIANDEIWNHLKETYKSSYLPPYQKVFYELLLNKRIILLQYFANLVNLVKRLTNKG